MHERLQETSQTRGTIPVALQQWVDARTHLSEAIRGYASATAFLESTCTPGSIKSLPGALNTFYANLEAVEREQLDIYRAQVALKKKRNSLTSPVYALPSKLLSYIFIIAVDRTPGCESSSEYARRCLSQVCSRWRQVALEVCPVWRRSSLTLEIDNTLEGGLTSARIGLHGASGRYKEVPVHRELSLGEAAYIQKTLDTIDPCVKQLEYINLTTYHVEQLRPFLTLWLEKGAPRSVTNINLSLKASVFIPEINSHFSKSLSDRLRHVERLVLSSVALDWSSSAFDRLTSMMFSDLPASCCPTLTQLAQMLSTCPHLENLWLERIAIPSSQDAAAPETVELVHLRQLTLLEVDVQRVLSIISPGREGLKLELRSAIGDPDPLEPLRPFAGRANIHRLTLHSWERCSLAVLTQLLHSPSSILSQPTPLPKRKHVETAPGLLPISPPMSHVNSQNQLPARARPAALVARTPSPQPVRALIPPVEAVVPRQSHLKRKPSALTRPGTSKLQRMRSPSRFSSSSSSPSRLSSDREETELRVPLHGKAGGGGWSSTGGSLLEDLRHHIASLEKGANGKTHAASRTWSISVKTGASHVNNSSGGLMGFSDLDLESGTVPPRTVAPKEDSGNRRGTLAALQDEMLALGLSTDAARASIRSAGATTSDNPRSPPKPGALLPAPARTETQSVVVSDIVIIFNRIQTQSQTETQMTSASLIGLEGGDLMDIDGEAGSNADLDVDVEADSVGENEEMEEGAKMSSSSRATSLATSTLRTRSMVKRLQLAAAAAKKATEDQVRRSIRMREMEERRQAAALREAEDKAKPLKPGRKRKDREELAESKGVNSRTNKSQEESNKKRQAKAKKKSTGSSLLKEPSKSKSWVAKPSASTAGSSRLKLALKTPHTNPFVATTPPASKKIKHIGSSSSLKSITGSVGKKAKGSISDAPGQALQAQFKVTQRETELQGESIELPDINSEYSDSDSEDEARRENYPEWTQSPQLDQALRDQATLNPNAIFGPIPPLKMGDLFKTRRSRLRKRTSSASWNIARVTTEEEIEYARRMGYIS